MFYVTDIWLDEKHLEKLYWIKKFVVPIGLVRRQDIEPGRIQNSLDRIHFIGLQIPK